MDFTRFILFGNSSGSIIDLRNIAHACTLLSLTVVHGRSGRVVTCEGVPEVHVEGVVGQHSAACQRGHPQEGGSWAGGVESPHQLRVQLVDNIT